MSEAPDEKELYSSVSAYFSSRGYFVISGCQKPGVKGTSEFGFVVDGQDMRADVVAARWDDVDQVETIAVECKRLGTMTRSVGAGLWQAIDYQVAFDRVFIATEDSGTAGNKRSVLEALGIGHLSVTVDSGRCTELSRSAFRQATRYDGSVRLTQIVPRLALFLAFSDVLKLPLRYGETFGGGGYIAKNVAGDIQYNSWFDSATGNTDFGINVERIDSLKKIVVSADWRELGRRLRHLKGHTLFLTKDPVPSWRSPSVKLLGPMPCPEVNTTLLRDAIVAVIEDRPRQWRPHLGIYSSIWKNNESLCREECTGKISSARDRLSNVMRTLAASI